MEFRFSKYNPKYRDSDNKYNNDEWTCFGDIGKYFKDKAFTMEEYLEIESKYIYSINSIISNCQVDRIEIFECEKYINPNTSVLGDYYLLLNYGNFYDKTQVNDLMKLFFRNYAWCVFGVRNVFKIEFGHDLYVHVQIFDLNLNLRKIVEDIQSNEIFLG